jgi:hypothetical protein
MHLLAMAVLLAVSARGEDPRREDFAYSIPVIPSTESPLYRVRLPLSVYRSLTRPDLGDLRVFNADGALVPHELWMPDDGIDRHTVPVRVVPLHDGALDDPSSVRIQIERGSHRASISLAADTAPASLSAYLIDAGPVEPPYPAERLILHWSEPAEGFVRELRVDASEDLASWSPYASAVVADLRRNGERLVRNDISLPPRVPRYLKISAPGAPLPMAVERVTLELSSRSVDMAWLELNALRSEPDGIHFEMPGPILVEEIELLPAERNTWTEVQIFSRAEAKDPWVQRARGAVYRFDVSARTRLDVESTRDRFWRLTTDDARGGLGGTAPELRVGYRPDDVVFVARGDAPFEIAYGSRAIGSPPRARESLRAIETVQNGRLAPSTDLSVGEPRSIAGERALRKPLVADWKQLVLWGVLVAASLTLLVTARAALSRSAGG